MNEKYSKYLIKQSCDNTRVTFDLYYSKYELNNLLKKLPSDNETYKMVSPAGGWSSCSLIMWIASKCKISDLLITTLRVGQKELEAVVLLKKKGIINNISFLLCGVAKQNKVNGKDYEYSESFESICDKNNIKYRYVKNHSKLILLDTDCGKYVVETSSNFNENPKIEQFSFEKSDQLYKFYFEIISELMK